MVARLWGDHYPNRFGDLSFRVLCAFEVYLGLVPDGFPIAPRGIAPSTTRVSGNRLFFSSSGRDHRREADWGAISCFESSSDCRRDRYHDWCNLVGRRYPAFFAEASQVAAGSVCAIELPSGSTVNPSAGTITLPNGSADAITKFPCSMTSVIWATGRSAIGKYLPFTLIVIATMALLYFVAVRSNKVDADIVTYR
jgi:hypothetical protein